MKKLMKMMNDSMREVAEFTKKISHFVQCEDRMDAVHAVMAELAAFTSASVLLCDMDGNVFVEKIIGKPVGLLYKNKQTGTAHLEESFSNQLRSIVESIYNLPLHNFFAKENENRFGADFALVLPIVLKMERIGTVFLYKPTEFNSDETLVSEFTAIVTALCLSQHRQEQLSKKASQKNMVKASLDTLSYSELEAVIVIFKALNGLEGLVIASQIAKNSGITRSAIVNALRKLESAAIVESRSLGVKGTYIKVKNAALLTELEKFK